MLVPFGHSGVDVLVQAIRIAVLVLFALVLHPRFYLCCAFSPLWLFRSRESLNLSRVAARMSLDSVLIVPSSSCAALRIARKFWSSPNLRNVESPAI